MTTSEKMQTDEVRDTLEFLGVMGGAPEAECEARLRYAMEVQPPNVIVELGVMRGQGICCFACGSGFGNQVPVIGVDLFGLRPSGYGAAYDNPENQRVAQVFANRFDVGHLVTLIRSDTKDAAVGWNKPIGLLTIDAGHQYEDVLADVKAWLPHVVRGGLLLMHDARNPAWPGVDRVITEEILPSGEWDEIEFIQPFSAWFRRKLS